MNNTWIFRINYINNVFIGCFQNFRDEECLNLGKNTYSCLTTSDTYVTKDKLFTASSALSGRDNIAFKLRFQ